MAYRNFTFELLQETFELKYDKIDLFGKVEPIEPSAFLQTSLDKMNLIEITTEKARSERIFSPVLAEVREINDKVFSIFSGEFLNGNKELGLSGKCDFMFTKSTYIFKPHAPFFILAVSPKEDIQLGLRLCIAQMLGAQYFNKKDKTFVPIIYGCVVTRSQWQFIKLQFDAITLHKSIYCISNISTILGVFQQIIDYYKKYI